MNLNVTNRLSQFKIVLSFFFIILLVLGVFVAVNLSKETQDIRKRASSTQVSLNIYPATETFQQGGEKSFQVIAVFQGGSAAQRLDYFRAEILFGKDYLQMGPERYIDVTKSGFNRIFRVDGPTAANENGKIVIELGADIPGSGPATDKPITLATIYLQGKSPTSSSQKITFGNIQVVSNGEAISLDSQNTKGVDYTVSAVQVPTDTPVPTITPRPTVTPTVIPSPTPTITPRPTDTPSITPSPFPTCPTKTKGDANCDGVIDGIDYSIWLNSQCHPAPNQKCLDTRADFSSPPDNQVDDDDYYIWFSNREI